MPGRRSRARANRWHAEDSGRPGTRHYPSFSRAGPLALRRQQVKGAESPQFLLGGSGAEQSRREHEAGNDGLGAHLRSPKKEYCGVVLGGYLALCRTEDLVKRKRGRPQAAPFPLMTTKIGTTSAAWRP